MPEFRTWILALPVIALSAGMASAQVGGGGGLGNSAGTQFSCSTVNAAVTPTLRAEGYTELAGDIVIACTGGSAPALGSAIPTANFTIFLNTAVTSRLLPASGQPAGTSEALLLVDEPGAALTGYGPSVSQTLCTSASAGAGAGGCTEFVGETTGGAAGINIGVPVGPTQPTLQTQNQTQTINTGNGTTTTITCTVANPCAAPSSAGANVFQGVVSGNAVTFFGIPVMPPTSVGDSRVFRITNIRANANQVTAGGPTPGSVVASISISGSNSLAITNSTLTVGFVTQGLNPSTTGLRNASNTGGGGGTFNQCSSSSITSTGSSTTANGGGLIFQENFATAFKTRFNSGATFNSGIAQQNVPGTIYNSESGFILGNGSFSNSGVGLTYFPGAADYGTRLKATFNNVPSGVSLYVSTRDLSNSFAGYNGTGPSFPVFSSNAVLVVSETSSDNGITPPSSSQTQSYTGPGPAGAIVPGIAPIVMNATGTGEAVWEVVNTNPAAIDTLFFGVYVNYSASPATNSPAAPSSLTVTLSFAPTPSGGGFTAAAGAAASSTLPIPRFSDSLDITKTYASFALCTTALLYPYVINTNGFDTGLAIANTSTDPFGTTPQNGTCQMNFYGSSSPSAAFVTPNVATGTVYANLASTLAPGFSGYIVAVCNFQFAHGFAFVSDVGARNLAMGYLALVVNNGTSISRGNSTPSGESLNN